MASRARSAVGARRATTLAVVFTVGIIVVALVLIVQERATEDPYRGGSSHEVTLVRQAACPSVWTIRPDAAHAWQTEDPVPADWTGDTVSGTLHIAVYWGEATVEAGGETVHVYGGKISGDHKLQSACTSSN